MVLALVVRCNRLSVKHLASDVCPGPSRRAFAENVRPPISTPEKDHGFDIVGPEPRAVDDSIEPVLPIRLAPRDASAVIGCAGLSSAAPVSEC